MTAATGFDTLSVVFNPLVPTGFLAAACAVLLVLTILGCLRHGWRGLLRLVPGILVLLALLQPSRVSEQREAVRDVAAIVVDQSPSQSIDNRNQRTEDALKALQTRLEAYRDTLDVMVIRPQGESSGVTALFSPLMDALSRIPETRRAGTFFITDGQIHDIPADLSSMPGSGPVHAILTGKPNETDRFITVSQSPSYGIVGDKALVEFEVHERPDTRATYGTATVVIEGSRKDGPEVLEVAVNQPQQIEVPISHAGPNIFTIETAPLKGELTVQNNRTAISINGVRDRLRVLLVSGEPHMGERTWRDLLTSDPGVDLVHFTILRDPSKIDPTPQSEMSLIAFPFHELFEVKLYDFDLIIFDRYQLNDILPDQYFDNIGEYVRKGGALLDASGPSYAGEQSLYRTSLGPLLPGVPTGNVLDTAFRPALTSEGKRHPITEDLAAQEQNWGPWLRQVEMTVKRGTTLMTGAGGAPLVVIDKVEQGRIGQIASDQVWLWARDYKGGGPHSELMRRLAHWLMKEPELDENALKIEVRGNKISVRQRLFQGSADQNGDGTLPDILVTRPDKSETRVNLEPEENGWAAATVDAPLIGIYVIDSGNIRDFALVGPVGGPEMQDMTATDEKLQPLVRQSRGGVFWAGKDSALPELRMLPEGRNYNGQGWLGLRRNNDYTVTGIRQDALLPFWAQCLLILFAALAAWWIEGLRLTPGRRTIDRA